MTLLTLTHSPFSFFVYKSPLISKLNDTVVLLNLYPFGANVSVNVYSPTFNVTL